jgi:hypothetical protein
MARVVQVPDIRKVDLPEARQAIPRPAMCRPRLPLSTVSCPRRLRSRRAGRSGPEAG